MHKLWNMFLLLYGRKESFGDIGRGKGESVMRKRRWIMPVSFIFFIISLFLVESSLFGSGNVVAYNGGYGTFDMKSYDADSVYSVLQGAKEGYQGAAIKYYVIDYLFIIAFLNFQTVIGISACKGFGWILFFYDNKAGILFVLLVHIRK